MEMAVRAASPALRAPAPSPSSTATRVWCCSLPRPSLDEKKKKKKKAQFKPVSVALPTSASLSLLALFSPPYDARAVTLPKDQIVSSITEVEKTIDQVQEASSGFLDTAQQIFKVVTEALKPAVPIVQQAGEQALKIASPAISEVTKKAQEAMQSSGIDAEPVMTAAKTVGAAAQQTTKVIEDAKPIASSAFETISSADPTVILGTAGALFITYLIIPPLWSVISFGFRGYKGNLTPAQALDLISSKNHILIDIRSEKDKDKSGVPRLPSDAKNRMIAIPLEELPSKLRGQVRNVKQVEAEIAALKISSLKKINKGSNIVIIDSFSDSAKIVARTLTSLGFKNCWVVIDGFSGRKGWLQSRLGTDPYNFSFVEVLSPSRIIPAAAGRFGTTAGRKLLPGSE
ncbi:calcium sensing receptor, chloroplastic [Punica granatum]|uniref:Calcium sensing receptor, chloroplastic n=2 Tax=Punica granatum TaxID=22663 RepID=A0A6P8BSF4_PUNGR|nr:calcium sensing receptor, chloroplastic [Punica granatum]XP_031372423.1 calcium sensing receptor, chloroplastic [Punica granatum]OWM90331.1 hypothetical protein CDL15_Pgr014633 [Punica granatum]PKI70357.1 hypothetical protein CRG98_009237 [Punica granatum]